LKLGRAYETLKDESKRRAYDLSNPSVKRGGHSPQKPTQTSRPPPASTPQSDVPSELAQIAALEKSKRERDARWRAKKNEFDSSIFEPQRDIRKLEQAIKNLNSIAAAEAAEETQKKSWGTWLLSPLYKKAEDSEEEKARKDRERQERSMEKNIKERRLESMKGKLREKEQLLRKAKEEIDAADMVDDRKIRVIQDRIQARKERERHERERVERERMEKIMKEQQEQREKQKREAAEALRKQQAKERAAQEKREEALRKQQAEQRAAQQKQQQEQARAWQKIIDDAARTRSEYSSYRTSESNCGHHGWWPKVEGHALCPRCSEKWSYLLQCPGCKMHACPRCQYDIRPRGHRRAPPRARTPSPVFFHDDYDYYD
jgi:hypothetical protein